MIFCHKYEWLIHKIEIIFYTQNIYKDFDFTCFTQSKLINSIRLFIMDTFIRILIIIINCLSYMNSIKWDSYSLRKRFQFAEFFYTDIDQSSAKAYMLNLIKVCIMSLIISATFAYSIHILFSYSEKLWNFLANFLWKVLNIHLGSRT